MVSIPRAVVYVDLDALEENYRTVKSLTSEGVKVLCAVKADAYGHGAAEVARRLESIGADFLGVATVDEGFELREHGISIPILVMSGIFPWDEIEAVLANKLTPVVYDFSTLERLADLSASGDETIKVHIKIDSGMGRLGFGPEDVPSLIEQLKNEAGIHVEGLMTHFSRSEERDGYGLEQIRAFKEVVDVFRENSIVPEIVHMANSGAIANYPEAYFDMVRVGVSLYGSHPSRSVAARLPVKQVMKYVSKIALIREFPQGRNLGYGGTFTTPRKTRIAYIPCGYADGYPRALSNRGSVLVRGKRCSIVGRVCMDWTFVDITDVEDVKVDEEVVLLGRSEGDVISADEIAELVGTIPYEVLCRISRKFPRVYT
jgi:alanine racemase